MTQGSSNAAAPPAADRARPVVPGPFAATVTVLVGVLVTVLLPLSFPAGGGPTGVDRAVADPIRRVLDPHPEVYRVLVVPSDGYVLLPILSAGVLWYGSRREFRRAGFLLVVPELAVAINTWALKPLWHRHLHHYLAYPSGHTVQFVAIATGFVLISATAWIRVTLVAAGGVLLVAVAVGMIGLDYHHPTDIAGGTAAAIALVTAGHIVVTRWWRPGAAAADPGPSDQDT